MEKQKIDGLSFEQSGLSEHGWELLAKWHEIRLRYRMTGDKAAFDKERKEFNSSLEESVEVDRLVKFLAMVSQRQELRSNS